MQNWRIAGNFVLLCVLNNMPPIIASKANPGGRTHMRVIQASEVVTLTRYWPYLSIHLLVSSDLKKSGYCNNLETSEVLAGTIPSANLTFPCISQSDNLKIFPKVLKSKHNKKFSVPSYMKLVYMKTITLNFSDSGFIIL